MRQLSGADRNTFSIPCTSQPARRHSAVHALVVACASVLMCLAGVTAAAAPRPLVTGIVTRVMDGDSLMFKPDDTAAAKAQRPIEVRLADIDAPELCQDHGPESKAALQALVLRRSAQLQRVARDRFGRQVARLTVDGVAIGPKLVEDGHAWSSRWRNNRGPLLKQERMARALNRGLHARSGAELPSTFRRLHGPCSTAVH